MKRKAFLIVGLGFEAAVLLWVFIYLGQKGDLHFNTGGWITALFVVLVLVIWFYQLIRIFK